MIPVTNTSLAHPRTVPNTRELRALELYRTRGHEIRKVGADLYLVPSCAGQGSYTVDYNEETCSCPDFRRHGETCKHIYCVGISLAKRRRLVCACVDGWVYIGFDDEHGQERQASYRCQRCG
jgi:hypothetical protein